jgi:branched-chain amino acid transport system permease protein
MPTNLGGGANGLTSPRVFLFGSSLLGNAGYFLSVACLCVVLLILRLIMVGRVGRAWLALGKDRVAALSNGIRVRRYGVLAYAVSGALAGLAGVLFAYTSGSIVPDSFNVSVNITVLLMIVLGGLESMAGPVIGAILIIFLNQLLQTVFSLSYPTLIDGLIILSIIRFAPSGAANQIEQLFSSTWARFQ